MACPVSKAHSSHRSRFAALVGALDPKPLLSARRLPTDAQALRRAGVCVPHEWWARLTGTTRSDRWGDDTERLAAAQPAQRHSRNRVMSASSRTLRPPLPRLHSPSSPSTRTQSTPRHNDPPTGAHGCDSNRPYAPAGLNDLGATHTCSRCRRDRLQFPNGRSAWLLRARDPDTQRRAPFTCVPLCRLGSGHVNFLQILF